MEQIEKDQELARHLDKENYKKPFEEMFDIAKFNSLRDKSRNEAKNIIKEKRKEFLEAKGYRINELEDEIKKRKLIMG